MMKSPARTAYYAHAVSYGLSCGNELLYRRNTDLRVWELSGGSQLFNGQPRLPLDRESEQTRYPGMSRGATPQPFRRRYPSADNPIWLCLSH